MKCSPAAAAGECNVEVIVWRDTSLRTFDIKIFSFLNSAHHADVELINSPLMDDLGLLKGYQVILLPCHDPLERQFFSLIIMLTTW